MSLYHLLASRPEIAAGVIRILCQTLWTRANVLVADYQYLQEVLNPTNQPSPPTVGGM